MVWDSRNNLLYVSKPSTAQKSKDAIVALSTRTGLNDAAAAWIYHLPAGSNPDRLALSARRQVSVCRSRWRRPGAAVGNNQCIDPAHCRHHHFAGIGSHLRRLSTRSTWRFRHGSNTTIAVARGVGAGSKASALALGGVAIYDGATQRAQHCRPLCGSRQHGAARHACNGARTGTPFTRPTTRTPPATCMSSMCRPPVWRWRPEAIIRESSLFPTCLFTSIRQPGWSMEMTGCRWIPTVPKVNFNAFTNGIMTPDPAGGKAYFVWQPGTDPNQLEYFVGEFDLPRSRRARRSISTRCKEFRSTWFAGTTRATVPQGVAFTTKKFNCQYSPCTVGDGRLFVINFPSLDG